MQQLLTLYYHFLVVILSGVQGFVITNKYSVYGIDSSHRLSTFVSMATPAEIATNENVTVLNHSEINRVHDQNESELMIASTDDIAMNGDAKKEEIGDRQEITNAIREYQNRTMHSATPGQTPHFPIETIVQRALDTVEDVFLHLRRVPYDYELISEDLDHIHRPTIVVLGSGWSAHALLKVADTYKLRIIVVSPSNHFVFTPMLASASVGTVEYRSMTEAVRAANPMIENYIEGIATSVDIVQKHVKIQLNSLLVGLREGDPPEIEIKYDKLIVAVGVKVADKLVPGAYEHCLRLKTCDDARRLRTAIGEALEFASRPDVIDDKLLQVMERDRRRIERRKRVTFAIVGGGPTGVELAGELTDFVKDITKPRVGAYPQLRDDIRIVLIHGGKDLVPQFDVDLRKHALTSLRNGGVDVCLLTKVIEVGDGYLKLLSNGTEELLYTGLNVWAAGTESIPFVDHLLEHLPQEAHGPQGKINVDPWLRCPMPVNAEFGSILVTGDVASFNDGKKSYLPQTAQVAGQQGAFIARILDRDYDLSVTPPKLKTSSEMMKTWLLLRGLDQAEGCTYR
jgi:NADH:ubiquinone reductase (H+-translocating)